MKNYGSWARTYYGASGCDCCGVPKATALNRETKQWVRDYIEEAEEAEDVDNIEYGTD